MAIIAGKGGSSHAHGDIAGVLSRGKELLHISTASLAENGFASLEAAIADSEVFSTLTTIQDSALMAQDLTLLDVVQEQARVREAITTYAIQNGDTLSHIAEVFDVDVQTLLWSNNIKNANLINPGMELKIPAVKGLIHTVEDGDTVLALANRYDAETQDIISFNRLTDEGRLSIGQVLVIPGGKVTPRFITRVNATTRQNYSSLPSYAGYYMRPVDGARTQGLHGQNGIDIGAPCSTGVYAAASGVVTDVRNSGSNRGYGLYVDIDHYNGTKTRYAHHSVNIVVSGMTVAQGQKIAEVGSTGKSTGCHLHFEVHGARNPF